MAVLHIGHHFYGAGNLGDDLMLQGFLDAFSRTGRADLLTCCSPFHLDSQQLRFPQVEWRGYDADSRMRSVRECDVWLGLGDTPFQNDGGPWFLEHLVDERELCRRFGKPMYFLGIGVNNREALADPRAQTVLDTAEHVWARDAQSAAWLAETCGPSKVSCAADLAHIFLSRSPAQAVEPATLALLLHFENPRSFAQETLASVLERTETQRHLWLVQEIRDLTGSERYWLGSFPPEILARLEVFAPNYARDSIVQLRHCWPVPEALISSRYHGAVVGAWAGSRVVVVERNAKLAGLAAQLSLPSVSSFTNAEAILAALSEASSLSRSALERLAELGEESCWAFFRQVGGSPGDCPLSPPRLESREGQRQGVLISEHDSRMGGTPMGVGLVAQRIDKGKSVVPLEEVIGRLEAGEIIVLRGCLQELGHLEEIHSILRNVLRATLGMDRADKAMEAGPQKLHCFVDSKELTAITKQLQEALEQVTQVTVKRVARELLGVQGDAALEESRNVRIFIPQDAWAPGRDDYLQFKRERNHGKLTLHGPHTDLWFYHPLNVINVWVAVGPVLQGNGMSFWPHLFGQRPPLGYDGCARDDQVFGEALNFALEPGDALLFHINHLHGSEINQTDQTRFVFSGRFTVGAPKLFDQPWHSYLHLDRVPAELGKHAPPNVTAAAPPATPPPTIDTSNQLPAPVGVRPGPDAGTLEFDAGALAVGEVRPLTDDYCVSRTAAGVFAFGRACPHEGADLAGGFVRAGQVHCPRHNLALNPQTGESSCRSLPRIATVPCVEIGDTVRLALPVSSGWQRFAQEPSARSLPAPCSVAAHGPPDAAELRCQLHELRAKLLQKEMELRMLAGVAEERLQVLQRVDAEAARLRKEIEDAQRLMRSPWKFIVNRVRRLYRRLRTTAVNPAQKADRTPG